MRRLRIALDFDGTYTADPMLWQDFVPESIPTLDAITVMAKDITR